MAGTAPMLNLVAYLLAFFLLSVGTSQAGSPTIADLRLDLQKISDALEWQGSIYDTYAPVLQRASEAYGTLTSMTKVIDSDSRAGDVRTRLERLIEESWFFTDESSDPEYKPGALETDSYITANVAEWRHAINYMSNNLEKPFCNLSLMAPHKSRRKKILSTMKRGTEFRDAPWTPMMVVIPAGSYVAGASPTEHDRWDVDLDRREFELPKRQVTISRRLAFSKTEITVAQFSAFADQTCYQTRDGSRWWNPANVNQFVFNETLSWRHPGFPQGPDHPVVAITRHDARAYARWLSAITGAVYRLPNEDEWEWAARGGAETTFFWGDDLDQANQYANTYDDSSAAANHFRWPSNNLTDGFPWTAPVASFKPNSFGLYDVTANAREFVEDDWMPDLSHSVNDGSAHNGPAPFPTVRGGAWNYNPKNLRLNYRSAYLSSEVSTNMFGFRLVREI